MENGQLLTTIAELIQNNIIIENKQDKTDSNLNTIDKTVSGAINEVNNKEVSNEANISSHVSDTDNPHNTNLSQQKDVVITSPTDKQQLGYDSATNKWINQDNVDEKVKINATSTSKYLGEWIDGISIQNVGSRLVAKSLDGLDATLHELNFISGLDENIMTKFSNIINANGGIEVYKNGIFNTYADLLAFNFTTLTSEKIYLMYVSADEGHSGNGTTYMADSTTNNTTNLPKYCGLSSATQRILSIDKVDLTSEVKNKLSQNNMDMTDIIKTTDLANYLKSDDASSTYATINSISGKVNTTDIIDDLTSIYTTKPLSANQGNVIKGLIDEKTKINDSATTSSTDTYSIDKLLALFNDKQNKILVSASQPIDKSLNNFWLDITSIPYKLFRSDGTNYNQIGSTSNGTSINPWIASNSYKINDLVIYNNGLYQCKIANNDTIFTIANWQAIDGNSSLTLSGDLSGDGISQKVIGIQGTQIEDIAYNIGDLLGIKSNGKFGKITPATAIGMTGITMIGNNISIASGEEKTFTHTSSVNVVPYVIEQIAGSNITDTHLDFSDSSKYSIQDTGKIVLNNNKAQLDIFTKLLMHMDDSNFTDVCGHTVANNGVTLDTINKVFGNGSAYFNGSSYISIPSSNDWNFGNGDFEIKANIMFSSLPTSSIYQTLCGTWGGNGSRGFIIQFTNSSFFISVTTDGTNGTQYIGNYTWSINTKYYISIIRNNNILYLCVDGNILNSYPFSLNIYTSTYNLTIGKNLDLSQQFFKGNIDELNIRKGNSNLNNKNIPSIAYPSPYIIANTPLYLKTTGMSNFSLTTIDSITSLTIPVTTPTNTSVKCLFSVDNGINWLYYDGSTIHKFTGDLTLSWGTTSSTNTQLQTLFTNLPVSTLASMISSLGIIPMNLDFCFQLNTTDSTVTPSISAITINYTSLAHEEYADIGKYDSLIADYGVKRINNSTLGIKNLKSGTKTIKLLVVTDGSGSGVDIKTLPTF